MISVPISFSPSADTRNRCESFNAAGAVASGDGAIFSGNHQSSELELFLWINTFIFNAKSAITGTDHHFDFDKYRYRYLAEVKYRVNHRFNLAFLVSRLLCICARTASCPERWLRLAEVAPSQAIKLDTTQISAPKWNGYFSWQITPTRYDARRVQRVSDTRDRSGQNETGSCSQIKSGHWAGDVATCRLTICRPMRTA